MAKFNKIKKVGFRFAFILLIMFFLILITIVIWRIIIEKKELNNIYSGEDINFTIKNKQTNDVVCDGNLLLFENPKVLRWNNLILCPIQDKKELSKGNVYKVYNLDTGIVSDIQVKNINVNYLEAIRIINNNLLLVVSQKHEPYQKLYFTKLPSDGNLKNIAFPIKKNGGDGTEIWLWNDYDFILKGGEADVGWGAGIYKFNDSDEKITYLRDISGGQFNGDSLLGKTLDGKLLFSSHEWMNGDVEYKDLFLTGQDGITQQENILSKNDMPQKVNGVDLLETDDIVLLKGINFIYPFDIKNKKIGRKIEIPENWIEDGFSRWDINDMGTSFCLYDYRNRDKNIKGQDILVKLPSMDMRKNTNCSKDPIISQYKKWKFMFNEITNNLNLPKEYEINFTFLPQR